MKKECEILMILLNNIKKINKVLRNMRENWLYDLSFLLSKALWSKIYLVKTFYDWCLFFDFVVSCFFCLGREKSYEFSGLKISNLCDSIAMTGELILILLFVWNKKWK